MLPKIYLPGQTKPFGDFPLVSVVTPFFNAADYLEECIQSVLGQTYQNWEYILADNCSTDGSEEIAKKYAMTDSRVHFFSEIEFLGQVENYNRALGYISHESKYCKIVQADDWLFRNCLAEMVSVAETRDNVGLVSSFSIYRDSPRHGGLALGQGPVYAGREAARSQLLGSVLFGSPTCVIYRSEIVRSRAEFFSTTTPYFEDTEVCLEILRNYDFGFVPQILTFNRRDNDSYWNRIEKYHPYTLHELMFVLRFGRHFLDPVEFARRLHETESRFYDLLAQGVVHGWDREFWKFHQDGLAWVGQKISRRRVAFRILSVLANAVLNPKATVQNFWHRARGW